MGVGLASHRYAFIVVPSITQVVYTLSSSQNRFFFAGEADPQFAAKFTALAVTYGFQGSPHIDKQNTGSFYGLALGDFPSGQGGICVECNPFVVAQIDTKDKLGKCDGRFPHWVAPYDESTIRFSLIYYQTTGGLIPPTTAVFGQAAEDVAQFVSHN